MEEFFSPKSVAIIGASFNPHKVGNIVAKNLIKQGYSGEVFLVNSKGGKLFGKKVYKSFEEVPGKVDLVAFAVPAEIVLELLPKIAKKGVKNFVIYSAGFKEVGDFEKEKKILELAQRYDLKILGPNCIGFVNSEERINLTFLKGRIKTGNISIVSQSGALGSWLTDYFSQHKNLGFRFFISVGNQTVFGIPEFLRFLADDPKTSVIGCYLEGVEDGKVFRESLSYALSRKPVVILKSGKTQQGAEAAGSHTGSIVGDDLVYQALFDQLGAIRADSLSEFLFLLKLFSFKKIPQKNDVLIITNAGGVGVLLTDSLVQEGIKLSYISSSGVKRLKESFGLKRISIHNPLDILGDAKAGDFKSAIEIALTENNPGAVLALLTPQANTEIQKTTKTIIALQETTTVPIFPIFLGGKSLEKSFDLFEKHKIVALNDFSYFAASLRKVFIYQEKQRKDYALALKDIVSGIKTDSTVKLDKSKQLLSDVFKALQQEGLPVIDFEEVSSIEDLSKAARQIKPPYVLKADLPSYFHKTEKSAVKIAVDSSELFEVFLEMRSLGYERLILQPFLSADEFFLGLKKNPIFGSILIFGLGGVYVETLKEVIALLYPFDFSDFEMAIEKAKFSEILFGKRNRIYLNLREFFNFCQRLINLFNAAKDLQEMDLNPLFLKKDKFFIADARIFFKQNKTKI